MDAIFVANRTPRPRARHRGPSLWILALVVLAILLAAGVVRAELRSTPVPVTEAGCDVSVTLEGPIARVTETHRLAASGEVPALAAYAAALPVGAVVDGFSVKVAGRDEPGVLVPAESLDNLTPPALGLAPDLGTLRVGAEEGHPVVEARLYPIAPSKVTGFTLRWSAPASYSGGVMSVVFPARGNGENLGRCRVRVDATTGTGIRSWASVRAGGVWVGSGTRVRGTVSGAAASDAFAIDARPVWTGTAPVLATAHATTAGEEVPSTVAVYVPDTPTHRGFAPARLLFLVDTSRSVGEDGRRAAVTLIETLSRAAPAGTAIEVVLFDRTARRVLGTWLPGNGPALARVTRAVREAPMAGGTDLGAALVVAAATLGGEPGHVVIVTDGVLPTAQSGTELLGAFAAPTGRIVVDALVPLAGNAAAPEPGGLESLTQVYGGRVLAFPADRPMPAAALTESLAAGQPIAEPTIEVDGAAVDALALPDMLSAGSGVVLTAPLERRPRRLALRARRGTTAITVRATALPRGSERFAVAAQATADERVGLADARRLGVLASGAAMIVIDRHATGGAARHDLARRTGAVTFTPSPEVLGAEPPSAAVRIVADPRVRRVGELPRSSVQLALRDQLVPRMRLCYRDALRASPTLAGDLVVELEVARAEVMSVNLGGDHFPEAMVGCVADAAFAMTTPAYELGGEPDTVFVIRKPIRFRAPVSTDDEPTVSLDDVLYPATNPAAPAALEVEPDAPL